MQVNEALTKVLREYPAAMTQSFAGNALAGFIRRDLPEMIRESAQIPEEYSITGVLVRDSGLVVRGSQFSIHSSPIQRSAAIT